MAVLKENGHTLRITMQTPNAQFVLTDAVPLPGSYQTPHNNPNEGVLVLRVKLENVKETTLRAVFTFDGDDTLPPEMNIDDFADFIQK